MAKKKPKTELAKSWKTAVAAPSERLVGDLRRLIEQSRQQVAQAVNSATVWLYWNVGKRIREDVLGNQRAGYGEQIVSSLSAQLTAEYGRGFSRQNLFRMIRFAEVFPDGRSRQTDRAPTRLRCCMRGLSGPTTVRASGSRATRRAP